MRTMGLDYGDKTIGVALSDELGWTAQGLTVIRRTTPDEDFARIRELVEEHQVGELVVGFPRNMDGSVGPRGEMCREFARSLQEKLKLPVQLWDERLTTAAAERTLLEADVSRRKRKQVIDKLAAVLILQGYLNFKPKR
jgi:putative Holliday junction resolvase